MEAMLNSETRQTAVSLPAFRRVLLCTDFSDRSQAARQAAIRLCQGRDAELTVMHVSEFGPIPAVTDESLDYILGLIANEYRSLQDATIELRHLGIKVQPVMAEGTAASAILDHIRRRGIDLAIIGTQAIRGLNRFVFGSTAEAIFRRAPCPILIARQTLSSSPAESHGRPVVFATDLDDSSLHALRYAASLAQLNHSSLHIVNIVPTAGDSSGAAALKTREALRQVAASLPGDGTAIHCEVLFGSDVSRAVVEYANRQDADFIAIGVRRKSTLSAHLPPQRIFRMIMTAACPVLTVACDQR